MLALVAALPPLVLGAAGLPVEFAVAAGVESLLADAVSEAVSAFAVLADDVAAGVEFLRA